MSTQMSTFANNIKRVFNDYTAYTESLIYDFTNSRLDDFSDSFNWRDLNANISFPITSSVAQYCLTGYTPDITSECIRSAMASCTLNGLKLISRERFNELGLSVTETGEPSHIIMDDERYISLYPMPNSTYALSLYCRGKHPYMSAGSQYFSFSDDKVRVIQQGVIADVYADKDDNRVQIYERKYEVGKKMKKRTQRKGLNESNQSLKLGSNLE